MKTPEEFVASAFRTTGTDPQNLAALANTLRTMGMPLYRALPPTGYYLTAQQWMNSVALVDRLNFAYQLTNGKFANQKFDAPRLVALGLLTPSSGSDLKADGVTAVSGTPQAQPTPLREGADVAVKLLETTMLGVPASAQTNQLIFQKMQQLPAGPNPIDLLNTLAALVMGSPEFQVR